MARPQRSPRMRDHWRDEGHRREDSVYRGRHRERSSDRRKSSATLKKRERSIDVEVKIKGRATAEEAHNISSRKPDKDQGRELSSYPEQRPSRSPRGRRLREGSYGRYKGSSRDRHRDPSRNRKVAGKRADNRKRSRSRSPRRAAALSYRERQRSPDLFYSRHTNQHVDTRTRHRYHLPVVPTTILSPTRTTHLWVGTSTFLLLGALDTDHLSGKGTEESTVTREDLQCQGLLAPKARTDRLRKRISFIITYQEQGNARLVPLVSLALCRGADNKSHLIEGDLDHVKDRSDRRKD
ncbi:MAG: hypothetical protein LQ343_004078 [Gyalolechia ehrenbergii]|nr:MAG: hypothetical protein LQ343_004078 [Gyalolechia ehrenbergii]